MVSIISDITGEEKLFDTVPILALDSETSMVAKEVGSESVGPAALQ